MKRAIVLWVLVVAVILGLSAGWATADVLYGNFGPSLSFDMHPADSYFINQSAFSTSLTSCPGPDCVPPTVIAVQFQPLENATFDYAQLPLFLSSYNLTGPNEMDIYLESDSSGSPGSIISEFELTNLLTSTPTVFSVRSGFTGETLISGSANPTLDSGTLYWLVVDAPDSGTVAAWSWNPNCTEDPTTGVFSGCDVSTETADSLSNLAFNEIPSPTGPWTPAPGIPRPAFEIDGTPTVTPPPPAVPEPGDGILLGTGLLALWLLRGRIRPAGAD